MTASTVSDRIEALSRPPVVSSPRPSLMCWPSSICAGHVGQRARVDDRGAQLGQPPLGEVRVGEVERLGDHDPEHRVAEELQALVGRDLPVLVGERAVRQGTLQQLGIQDRITERCAELVGGQRTIREPGDGRPWRRTGRTGRTHGAGGAWRRRRGWRTSRGSARRPSTANGGGACCCATSSASEQPWCVSCDLACFGRGSRSSVSLGQSSCWGPAVSSWSPAQRGSIGASCAWSGSSASRAPHSMHNPGQSSLHSGWNGSASTTASRSRGSRSSRSSSSRLVSSSRSRSSCSAALVVLVGVDVELLQPHVDLVLDRLQAPYALPLERGRGRAREQHALHDRLEPQVELDRRTFGDSEDFDAKLCRRRNGELELHAGTPGGGRARGYQARAAPSGPGWSRRTPASGHQHNHGIVSVARASGAKRVTMGLTVRAGQARRSARRCTSCSRTDSGTSPRTSPPRAATSLIRLEDTNALPTAPGRNTVSTCGEVGVHLRHRQLVLVVAGAAQTLDDRDGVDLAAEVDDQPVEARHAHVGDARGGLARASRCARRAVKSRFLRHVDADGDDDLVEELGGAPDDVEVAVGHRVERPGADSATHAGLPSAGTGGRRLGSGGRGGVTVPKRRLAVALRAVLHDARRARSRRLRLAARSTTTSAPGTSQPWATSAARSASTSSSDIG